MPLIFNTPAPVFVRTPLPENPPLISVTLPAPGETFMVPPTVTGMEKLRSTEELKVPPFSASLLPSAVAEETSRTPSIRRVPKNLFPEDVTESLPLDSLIK